MGCGVVERHLEMAQPTKKQKLYSNIESTLKKHLNLLKVVE